MIKVLKIEQISGYKNSFYVYFDNDEKLRCFTKNIADFGLRADQMLEDERFEELKAAVSESNTRERAARLISRRQMSEKELEQKLLLKGEPEENVHNAICWLREMGALDDGAYAMAIVGHYAKKGYGLARIKDELFRRYIPRELWEEALERMPDCEDVIDRLIAKRLTGTRPDRKELKKVSEMLYRRGFSWDEIRSALNRYEADPDWEDI